MKQKEDIYSDFKLKQKRFDLLVDLKIFQRFEG